MKKYRRDDKFIASVASRIKELREERGVSQDVFYIDTDINISRIEMGKQNISIYTLKYICDYFNISLEDFFKGIDN
ncbi:helix-turn-helix domain-containing protein [Paludibacteraceae bacterium OttesenSCG-928-F17]|nr:helix-turn-helix domain-containing protein [Paludibacteraceae bacterium OttesenSCG-928-F17]